MSPDKALCGPRRRHAWDSNYLLPLLRRWSRRLPWLHGYLIVSLLLLPSLPLLGEYRIDRQWNEALNEGGGDYQYFIFDDQNNNGVQDGGESSYEVYASEDPDSDGLNNAAEFEAGTSPSNPDSDYDGITDYDEAVSLGGANNGYNPNNWDSDGDGYSDHDEFYNCYAINYFALGGGSSFYDWDGDGYKNHEDPYPQDSTNYVSDIDSDSDGFYDSQDSHPQDHWLWSDWNGNGVNDDAEGPPPDSDADDRADNIDSHPDNALLWSDWNGNGINDDQDSDADGHPDETDSHPQDGTRWGDWNGNGVNDDQDSDGDLIPDEMDSHPESASLWSDWDSNGVNWEDEPDTDGDGVKDVDDTHPYSAALWDDHSGNGINDSQNVDGDSATDDNDSHPDDSSRWDDWNNNGFNDADEVDSDGDGRYDFMDSHAGDSSLWSDWNGSGINDDQDTDLDLAPDDHDSHPNSDLYWSDWDGDGVNAENDSHQDSSLLWSDWDGNEVNNDQDGDEDGRIDTKDSHPRNPALKRDWDYDGVEDAVDPFDLDSDGRDNEDDSHPEDAQLWSDWDGNGVNNDTDGDEDTIVDGLDSHARNASLWSDWDGDGINAEDDSHPEDAQLWSDWDGNAVNNDTDGDEDGIEDAADSNPRNALLWSDGDHDGRNANEDSHPENAYCWSDWNGDGDNDDNDGDEDGSSDQDDTDPRDSSLWNDHNRNGVNDHQEQPPSSDFDGDGSPDLYDSHPADPTLWNDRNGNSVNDENESPPSPTDFDGDGAPDSQDTHPLDPNLWNDHNGNNINDELENTLDRDGDGYPESQDTDPLDPGVWNDVSPRNGINDHEETGDYDGDLVPNNVDTHPWDGTLWNDRNMSGVEDHLEEGADYDSDGYFNTDDSHPMETSLYSDWDFDGLNLHEEIALGSDPEDPDSDNDGLRDGDEVKLHGTSLANPDTDEDGLTDFEELRIPPYSSPLDRWSRSRLLGLDTYLTDWQLSGHEEDADADGIPDPVESAYGLNSQDPSDAAGDLDADTISNLQEYQAGTSLWGNNDVYDTDGDGITDLQEDLINLWHPGMLSKLDSADATLDPDGDGVLNYEEMALNLRIWDANSNTPAAEVHQGSAMSADMIAARAQHPTWQMPVRAGDMDGDQMLDVWEHHYRARGGLLGLNLRDPLDWNLDYDGDALLNRNEVLSFLHPLVSDYTTPPTLPNEYDPGAGVTSPYNPTIPTPLAPGEGVDFNVSHVFFSNDPDSEPIYEVRKQVWVKGEDPGDAPPWRNEQLVSVTTRKGPPEQMECMPSATPPTAEGQYCPCVVHGTANAYVSLRSESGGGEYLHDNGTPDDPTDDYWASGIDGSGEQYFWTRNSQVPCPAEQGEEPQENQEPATLGYAAMRIRILNNAHDDIRREVIVKLASTGTIIHRELCIPEGQRESLELNIPSSGDETVTISVIGEPDVQPGEYTVSANDSAGPRYRKVGLNGVPIPDSKPQVQNENGELPEETYIDAFNAQLRHSVSDIYVADESTLLSLQLRRDVAPDVWNERSGLRPDERPFQPFGPGWSSNVCSYVQFTIDTKNRLKAMVVDEMGGSQTFQKFEEEWRHDRIEGTDIKTAQNRFEATTSSVAGEWSSFNNIVLHKKFGTTCHYSLVPIGELSQFYSADRIEGSDKIMRHFYARLNGVVDRYGDELIYEYPDSASLIPCRIYDPKRPGHQISIHQEGGRIVSAMGPSGDVTNYSYGVQMLGGLKIYYLSGFERGGHAVQYEYFLSNASEYDSDGNETVYHHRELGGIVDERGGRYGFSYEHNTTIYYCSMDGVKQQFGLPMKLLQVTSPMAGSVFIYNHRYVSPTVTSGSYNYRAAALPVSTTFLRGGGADARVYLYRFTGSIGSTVSGLLGGDDPGDETISYTFQKMEIVSPDGEVESYDFDLTANMALKSIQDRNGFKTTFAYEDAIEHPSIQSQGLRVYYDDPTKETNELGQTKAFTYDPRTRILTSVTDSRGVKTQYSIDAIGRRTQETIQGGGNMPGGRVEHSAYNHALFPGFVTFQRVEPRATDPYKPPMSISPPVEKTFTLGSDTSKPGWWRTVTETQWADGVEIKTTTVKDFAGNKRSVTDGRGYTTCFTYDGSNRLTGVQYPDGSSKSLHYDPHGNLIKEVDETGRMTFHSYDALNRRTSTTVDLNGNGVADSRIGGDLVQETSYNDLNLPVLKTDTRGIVTRYVYDVIGRPTQVIVNDTASSAADKQVTVMEYKVSGVNGGKEGGSSVFDTSGFKPVRITDPAGRVTTFTYDKLYRVTKKTATDAGNVLTTYASNDSSDRPATVSHPEVASRKTLFSYDALGQQIRVVQPDGAMQQAYYAHHGKPWKTIDELGAVTTTHYDASGRAKAIHAPAVSGGIPVTETGYDLAGNAIWVKDPLGRATFTSYDRRNRPVFVTTPEVADAADPTMTLKNPVVETQYDAAGRVLTTIDPLGGATQKFYDGAGRAVRTVDALNQETLLTLDAGGNVLTTTNPAGQVVTNVYDAFNRLIQSTDHAGIVNSFEYDKAGNRTKVTDGRGKITTFAYDGQNRLTQQTFQGSLTLQGAVSTDVWTYTYDAAVKTSQTDPRGLVTSYTYDQRDRLKTVVTPAVGSVAANARTYQYDLAGRILSVTESSDASATVAYSYDAHGRVLSETSYGVTHTYGFDLAGNRTLANHGDGRRTVTEYDDLNRPVIIREGPAADFEAQQTVTQYGYDLAGRALQLRAGNGQFTHNAYDVLGRLTDRVLHQALPATEANRQAGFSWQHDAIGNVLRQTEAWYTGTPRVRVTNMTYDGANRLLTETIAETDAQTVTTAYAYDAGNNRISKTTTASGEGSPGTEVGHWSYTYNSANQLTHVDKRESPGGAIVDGALYHYDAMGNRARKLTQPREETTAASLLNQGLTYTAAVSGPTGNALSVQLQAGSSGSAMSAALTGNTLNVTLARSEAVPATWMALGITATAKQAGPDGNALSLTLEPGQPDGEASVAMVGSQITVTLAMDAGTPGTLESQGLTYTEQVAASGATIEIAPASASGQAASVSSLDQSVIVRAGSTAGDPATLTVDGLMFTARQPGSEGNNIQVLLRDPNDTNTYENPTGGLIAQYPLSADGNGNITTTYQDVADYFNNDSSTPVTVTVLYEGQASPIAPTFLSGGGANFESVPLFASTVANLLASHPLLRATYTVDGEVMHQGAQGMQGAVPPMPTSTATEIVALLNAHPEVSDAITVSGTGQQPLSGHAASFAGGADGELTSTASQVASYLAGLPEVQAALTVSGSGEEVLAPTGVLPLTGGATTTVGSGTTTYAWDGLGRLASVTMPDNQIYRYRYDYRTRRTGIEKAALAEAPAQHTAVVFSGGLSLAEYEFSTTPPATLTQPVTSTVRYVRGPDMGGGVGGLLYSHRAGAAKYNLSNGRGDIVAQSDGTGSLTWTASYEAYGKRTKETGTNQDKQRANTKDEDPTGLLNEGFRYRDIETGVWLSRDPAGFVDGPNLYAYVKQNPWTGWDPDGLAVVDGKDRDDKTGKWNPSAQLYKVKYNPKDPEKSSIIAVSAKNIQKKNALIWINGMDNNRNNAVKLGANHTGSNEFYMIHNPSNGALKDGGECIPNKLGVTTKVATTTADILRDFDLPSAKIVAHSQGTMILSHALRSLNTEGKNMTGMRTELDGAAANTWRLGRFLKSVGAEKPAVTGHALDPVHNIIGMNTINPLRIAGSVVASPLVFLGGQDYSPHTTKNGGKLPAFFKSKIFSQIIP